MKSLNDLMTIREKVSCKLNMTGLKKGYRICVGTATCGIAAGATAVLEALKEKIQEKDLDYVSVVPVGCIGECALEPIVEVFDNFGKRTTYCKVKVEDVEEIVQEHIISGNPVKRLLIETFKPNAKEQHAKQLRIALRNCGLINPYDIDEYIAKDGYFALAKVLSSMTPEDVIKEVSASGLRGRGGGGFLTGLKWELCYKNKNDKKYLICNADEGDPGAFMDRAVLEGDPHSVIEAMVIGGYAIGANQGYVYIRSEYPLAVKNLQYAINQAYEYGFLGKNILNSNFSFDLELRLGAGAFVCGEETALIASIEGERGMPRNKPPFPAQKGLWGYPTVINNVETFANIPAIINKGAKWFSSIGSEKSKGTKVFALGGKINNTGLIEIPMGMPLREVIYEVGGGIPNGKKFKAVQTGGPSGGCLAEKHLDTPIDYDTLTAQGSMMGSGGMIVMDEDNCMVDVAKFYLEFTVDESCGKCVPCREGTKRMLEILEMITNGDAELKHLEELKELANMIKNSALCNLGVSAPNPVLSTLQNFYDEYLAHVVEKRCPAGVCKELVKYEITDKCIGCGKCKRNCPVSCISGALKQRHTINQAVCIKCGACKNNCPVDAIIRV